MTNNVSPWLVYSALSFVQVAYGGYHVLTKVALKDGVDRFVFCVWRDVIALLFLAPAAILMEGEKRPVITNKVLASASLLGLTGVFGNQLLFLFGLNLTSPAASAAIQPSIPVFTFLLAILFGLERVSPWKRDGVAKICGVFVCIIGASVLATYQGPPLIHSTSSNLQQVPTSLEEDHSSSSWKLGILCLLGNCGCMATYLVLQAPVLLSFPAPVSLTALSYGSGTILIILTTVLISLLSDVKTQWLLNGSQIIAATYAGVVASALNYYLLTWANQQVGPTIVSLFNPIQPLASSILSYVFLGNAISLGSVLGGSLVLAGLYLVIWGKSEGERDGPYKRLEIEDGNSDVSSRLR